MNLDMEMYEDSRMITVDFSTAPGDLAYLCDVQMVLGHGIREVSGRDQDLDCARWGT